MVRIKFILCLALLLLLFEGQGQNLKGSVALRVITPNPLLPVSGGVGTPKPTHQKQGDLYVRVMVLSYDTVKVAFASIDNLGWPSQLGNKVRQKVQGIKPENILIGATHTHSAPDAYAFPDEKGVSHADMKYLNWCVQQMADAINEAVLKLEEVHVKLAYGEVAKGISYNYYAPELFDPRCGVIQIVSKQSKKALGTLVNYAVHPEVIGSKQGILSPDLCGPLYSTIEEKGGGLAIFFNGAQGGMVTADNRRPNGKEENNWAECVRIGSLLGNEALRLIAKAEFELNPILTVKSWKVSFPVESPIMKFILQNSPMGYALSKEGKVSTIQNLVSIGSAEILTIPGEALPNIGYYLKRKMNSNYPFLFGLTNDAFGYILTKEDFNSFKRYQYVSETSLGEETGSILVEESLKHFKK